MNRKIRFAAAALAAVVTLGTVAGNTVYAADSVSITNVSYDPTRELYEQYNKIFQEHWKEKTGQDVDITQSHGGSGKQAIEVANGLEADVVTLALEYDVDAIQNAGLIDDGWIDEFPDDSSPYTSTIVFLVRKGNPKGIKDWDDLVKDGVGVITPNPKTSGGARWNYLAAWAYAKDKFNGDEDQIKDFIKKLYQNVLVLDSGARGATTSFVENGQGDVLIAWENEAYLSVKDYPDDYEIITPSISILAQPSVAVVDTVVDEVVCDGEKIAFMAVEHLIELGHTNIGYIGECHNEARYRGFVEALYDHHLELDPDFVIETNQTEAKGYEAMEKLLAMPDYPTGIYCANDITAVGVLKLLSRRKNIYMPSVIASDDIEQAQFTTPMLTTVHLPKEDMGKFALWLLMDRINNGHKAVTRMELECKLMVRSSCTSAQENGWSDYCI